MFFLFGHLSEILTNRPEGFPVSFFSDAQIAGWGKFPLGGNISRYTHQHGIIDFERISEGCMWKPDPQRFSTGCVKTPLEPYTRFRGFGGAARDQDATGSCEDHARLGFGWR